MGGVCAPRPDSDLTLPRGVLTDSLRGVMVAEDVESLQATTSKLAQLLVQSRASHGAYGVSKVISFTLLGLLLVRRAYQPAPTWVTPDVLRGVHGLAYATSLVALAFCWIRIYPVLAEAWLWGKEGRLGNAPSNDPHAEDGSGAERIGGDAALQEA